MYMLASVSGWIMRAHLHCTRWLTRRWTWSSGRSASCDRRCTLVQQGVGVGEGESLLDEHRYVAILAARGAYAFTGETSEISLANVELVSGGSDRMISFASLSSSTA